MPCAIGPEGNGRKADPPGRILLRRAVREQRRDVVLGAVLGMGHQTVEALVPVLIGLAVDEGVVDGDVPGLLLWLGIWPRSTSGSPSASAAVRGPVTVPP